MSQSLTSALRRIYGSSSLLLTLACIFFAGNVVAGRLAPGEISPMVLTFVRWVLVISVLWPIYGGDVRAHWGEIRAKLGKFVLMGAMGFTAFNALFYVGAHYTTGLNLGILQGSLPVFVLVIAFIAHGTRVSVLQVAGVLITIAGVVVVATGGDPLALLEVELNRGDLCMLAACALYAFYTVALRDRPEMPGAAFFTLLALIAAVTSLPLLAVEAIMGKAQFPTMNGWLITAYVAIFPSCLAQIFVLRGVDLVGPGRAGVFINLVPVFAAIMSVALLGEPIAPYHAIALVLVLGGILLAQRAAPGKKAG